MAFEPFTYIDDDTSNPGDLVSAEFFSVLCANINYLMDSMPVGSIVPILDGFPGCPTPDPSIWQECDGSLVSQYGSPLFGTNVPNYADGGGRYMRMYDIPADIGTYGGSNTKDLTHNHGGFSGYLAIGAGGHNVDGSSNALNVISHRHSIPSDLGVTNFEPLHFVVKHFMKIR